MLIASGHCCPQLWQKALFSLANFTQLLNNELAGLMPPPLMDLVDDGLSSLCLVLIEEVTYISPLHTQAAQTSVKKVKVTCLSTHSRYWPHYLERSLVFSLHLGVFSFSSVFILLLESGNASSLYYHTNNNTNIIRQLFKILQFSSSFCMNMLKKKPQIECKHLGIRLCLICFSTLSILNRGPSTQ